MLGALFLLLISFIASSAEVALDIREVAGNSQSQVARYLGVPLSCSGSSSGLKCRYSRGQTEIVYFNNKAEWITVHEIDHLAFNSEAITALGLKSRSPDRQDEFRETLIKS